MVKIQFWYWRNFNYRSSCWIRRSTDGKQQSKGSKGMEDPSQDKRNRKLLRVCKLLLKIYKKLQSYGKTSQQAQRKKKIEMGNGTLRSIWRIKREDCESTCTCPTKKRRKIPDRNWCIRICHRRSSISRVKEGEWKPIVFLSRTMQHAERNYKIYDKELLTIVEALIK